MSESTSERNVLLRTASPNEQRTISRESLGFYNAVIVGGCYELPSTFDAYTPASYYGPLRKCINEIPYLSVVIQHMHTDKAYFQRVPHLNLEQHVIIQEKIGHEDPLLKIKELLETNLDTPFPADMPPWKIIVLPSAQGCLVAFAYSHAIGDGKTGTSFHHSFLRACRTIKADADLESSLVPTPTVPLPEPFDTPQRLPISWAFLLAPFIAQFVPTFINNLLGLRASASLANSETWTGSKILFDPHNSRSRVKVREIEGTVFGRALQVMRRHDAKLTGTFQQLVAHALGIALRDTNYTNVVSQTAIDMRRAVGLPDNYTGNFASGCYIVHRRAESERGTISYLTEEQWMEARTNTQKLAECASTLQDQAIGLLRYVSSIRKWTAGKIGKERDASFELSNIGAFDKRSSSSGTERTNIMQMFFAQPGGVLAAPLAFNLVSVKGGSLIYTVTWRSGALGSIDMNEDAFVEMVCSNIDQGFQALE